MLEEYGLVAYRFAKYTATLVTLSCLLLQGCVTSKVPLFDESSAVADPSLTGHYIVPQKTDDPPVSYDVYLKSKKYIIVHDNQIAFIATLHRWHDDSYLAQMRGLAKSYDKDQKPVAPYGYLIVRKTSTGVDLNTFECGAEIQCEVSDRDKLMEFASLGEKDTKSRQLSKADKVRDLGR